MKYTRCISLLHRTVKMDQVQEDMQLSPSNSPDLDPVDYSE